MRIWVKLKKEEKVEKVKIVDESGQTREVYLDKYFPDIPFGYAVEEVNVEKGIAKIRLLRPELLDKIKDKIVKVEEKV